MLAVLSSRETRADQRFLLVDRLVTQAADGRLSQGRRTKLAWDAAHLLAQSSRANWIDETPSDPDDLREFVGKVVNGNHDPAAPKALLNALGAVTGRLCTPGFDHYGAFEQSELARRHFTLTEEHAMRDAQAFMAEEQRYQQWLLEITPHLLLPDATGQRPSSACLRERLEWALCKISPTAPEDTLGLRDRYERELAFNLLERLPEDT